MTRRLLAGFVAAVVCAAVILVVGASDGDGEGPHAAGAVARLIVQHAVRETVRAKGELPRLPSRRQRRRLTREVGAGGASAVARSAEVTGLAIANGLGQYGTPADRHVPSRERALDS